MKFMEPCFVFYVKISTIVRVNIHLCIIKLFDCSKYEVFNSHCNILLIIYLYIYCILIYKNSIPIGFFIQFYVESICRINMSKTSYPMFLNKLRVGT